MNLDEQEALSSFERATALADKLVAMFERADVPTEDAVAAFMIIICELALAGEGGDGMIERTAEAIKLVYYKLRNGCSEELQ